MQTAERTARAASYGGMVDQLSYLLESGISENEILTALGLAKSYYTATDGTVDWRVHGITPVHK